MDRRRNGRALITLALGGALLVAPATLPGAVAAPASTVDASPFGAAEVVQRSHIIPINVTLGGGSPLPGARLVVKDASGKVALTARTNAKGYAFVPRAQLPESFTVAVNGGSQWTKVGKPKLQTTDRILSSETRVVFLSPVTGVASIVAKRLGVSYARALTRTKRAMHVPSWMSPAQFSTVPQAFSGHRLRVWAKRHGGTAGAINELARRVISGKAIPDFSPMLDGGQPRGAASWVGESVMAGIVEGSASEGTEMVVGDVFGQSDPALAALAEIGTELANISAQLTQLQASVNQLTAIMEQSELDVLTSSMSTIMGNVSDQWPVYQAAMSLDPTSADYTATLAGFVQDWKTDIGPYMGEFNTLFSTPAAPGVIQTLYNNNNAPWWVASDVENIQSTIDYFGTYQAMATALLNESWWFSGEGISGETPQYIQTENATVYQPQNSNIYLSMPTSIGSTSVVVPGQQMIYQLFSGKVSYVQEQTNLTNANGYCGNPGKVGTYDTLWPQVIPSTTTWSEVWGDMVTGPSTVSSSSAFAQLSKPRTQTSTTGTATTTYALPTLAAGASGALAMVSAQTAPIASFITWDFGSPDAPILWSWLWCNNSTVSLVSSTPQNWVYNFGMDYDGDNLPGNKALPIYGPIPVAVLAQQPGSFGYVAPPPS